MSFLAVRFRSLLNTLSATGIRFLQPRFGQRSRKNGGRLALATLVRLFIKTEVSKEGFVRSVYGPWLSSRYEDRTFRLCLRGSYGFFYSNYLRKYKLSDFHFIDVGANQGLFSLIASENPRCRQSFAFEPNPDTVHHLSLNVQKNAAKIEIHPCAISSEDGVRKLNVPFGHSGAAALVGPGASGQMIDVETSGSEYLVSVFGSRSGPFLLKIDVEGHEHEVLSVFSEAGLLSRTHSLWIEVRPSTYIPIRELAEVHGLSEIYRTNSAQHWDVLFQRNVDSMDSN